MAWTCSRRFRSIPPSRCPESTGESRAWFASVPSAPRRGSGAMGCAGAVTVPVSQAALGADADNVVLFTDLANPTSNALYQRIGYRPVEGRVALTFGS